MFRQVFISMVLIVGLPFIFGYTLEVGIKFADGIHSTDAAKLLQEAFGKTATDVRDNPDQEGEGSEPKEPKVKWYHQVLSRLVSLVPGPAQVTALVMELAAIAFPVITHLVNMLWLALAVILFVFGPIPAVLAILPGPGARVAANWYGAVVQLTALRVWLAICAWFIEKAQIIFLISNSIFSPQILEQRIGATTTCLLFVILYVLGPFIIFKIFPFSSINSAITQAAVVGTAIIAKEAKAVATAKV
ncbi:MAG: hypothetical protein AB1489_42515 [Acidobacteriota bacterium]